MLRFIIVFIFSLLSVTVMSQHNYHITHYGEFEGLQSELVKGVTKDKCGFLWLATDEGLVRYNGREFTRYRDELPSPYIKSVLCAKSGDLYATTDMGFIKINTTPNSCSFEILLGGQTTHSDSLLWFPKLLYEDANANIWFSDNVALYRSTNNIVKRFLLPPKNQSFNWQRASSFAEDKQGNLFAISEPGFVYMYDPVGEGFIEVSKGPRLGKVEHILHLYDDVFLLAADYKLIQARITTEEIEVLDQKLNVDAAYLTRTNNTTITVASWTKGLYELQLNGENIFMSKVTAYTNKVANYVFTDGDKFWVTSDNGLYLFSKKQFSDKLNEFSSEYIQDVAIEDSTLWFSDGSKVFKVLKDDAKKNIFVDDVITLDTKEIMQLVPSKGGLWYTSGSGKLYWRDKVGKSIMKLDLSNYGKAIFNLTLWDDKLWLCQDRNPSLLAIDQDMGITTYGLEHGLIGRPVFTKVSPAGDLYVGCSGDSAYLFRFDKLEGQFVNLSKKIEEEHSDAIITSDIAFDEENNCLWVGTSIGLYRYNNQQFSLVDLGDMSREAVKALTIDKDNGVWIANSRGLVCLLDGEYLVFDERAGLPTKIVSYRALHTDNDNCVWAGTVSGLTFSKGLKKPKATNKPILISFMNNQTETNNQTHHTFLSTSFFNFEFVSPTYPTQTVNYEIRLLSKSDVWQLLNKKNELLLSKLEPNDYELQIKAKQGGNYAWSKPFSYKFKITLPWYKTWWVLVLISIFVLLFVVVTIRFYTTRLKQERNLLSELVDERTKEIRESNQALELSRGDLLQSKNVLESAMLELEKSVLRYEIANAHLESQTSALNSTAIVSMTDSEGYIVLANDNFCQLSGYSRKELLGEKHSLLKSGIHTPEFYADMWKTIQKRKWRGEICNRNKDGSIYWVDATIVPFIGESGKPDKYLAIRIDITESKSYEQKVHAKNEETLASIQYATFIQGALLPPLTLVNEILPNSFVFYMPRDMVSGDFYWVRQVKHKTIVAAVDCTGHGVPGAMMSMLGIAFLNEVSLRSNRITAGQILDHLREQVKTSFRQVSLKDKQSDGMDMSLCIFDDQTQKVEYAGAHLPIYTVDNGDLTEHLPTPNPIGLYRKEKPFETRIIQATPNTSFYMFSDGYADQFGGEKNQKFMSRKFKNLFQENAHLSMAKQKEEVIRVFQEWKGDCRQVDDVLVLGFQFPIRH